MSDEEAYETCAKLCDEIAEGRMKQYLGAQSQKLRAEARDFQSMAMQARQLAFDIRALAKSPSS